MVAQNPFIAKTNKFVLRIHMFNFLITSLMVFQYYAWLEQRKFLLMENIQIFMSVAMIVYSLWELLFTKIEDNTTSADWRAERMAGCIITWFVNLVYTICLWMHGDTTVMKYTFFVPLSGFLIELAIYLCNDGFCF